MGNTLRTTRGMRTLLVLVLACAASLQANAETSCTTTNSMPGLVQVYGNVKAGAGASDTATCTTAYTCLPGARTASVYAASYSDSATTKLSADNAVKFASGREAIAGCEGAPGDTPLLKQCHDEATAPANPGLVTAAQCTVVVEAQAGQSAVGNATCFCGP